MKTINILLVSDFHSGASDGPHTGGTAKDKSLSQELTNNLLYRSTRDLFLGSVMSLLAGKKIDLLACCGDLSHQGSETGIIQGVQYLAKLAKTLGLQPERVLVAPGNHDLCRSAKGGRELARFRVLCRRAGFIVPDGTTPGNTTVKGIPIFCVNSCLGGTEHALHGVPEKLWKRIKLLLKKFEGDAKQFRRHLKTTVQDQIAALDVPAVGTAQLETLNSMLLAANGNCAVVLGHHNPVATPMIDIRPYAGMIDAGRVIYSLIGSGKKVMFLHGHVHCDCALALHSPESREGLFMAIGSQGLHDIPSEGGHAALVTLHTDNRARFLTSIVTRFAQNASVYTTVQSFAVQDTPQDSTEYPLAIENLERDKSLSFCDAAKKLERKADTTLAADLLRNMNTKRLVISGLEHSDCKKWLIIRR